MTRANNAKFKALERVSEVSKDARSSLQHLGTDGAAGMPGHSKGLTGTAMVEYMIGFKAS